MTRTGWPSWVAASTVAVVLHAGAIVPLHTLISMPAETAQVSFSLATSDTFTPMPVAEADVAAAQLIPAPETSDRVTEQAPPDPATASQQSPEIGERKVSDADKLEDSNASSILFATEPPQGAATSLDMPFGEVHGDVGFAQEASPSAGVYANLPTGSAQSSNGEQSPEIKSTSVGERVQQSALASEEAGEAGAVTSQAATSSGSETVGEQVAGPEAAVSEQGDNADDQDRLALVVRPGARPPEPEQVPADLSQVIAGFPGGQCFHAVPADFAGKQPRVTSYAALDATLDAFESHMKSSYVGTVEMQRRSIQSLQCAAIEFAHRTAMPLQPAFLIELEQSLVSDGGEVLGRIQGVAATRLYVLLVDDEGMAQDVTRYAVASPGGAVLNMPVHVKGEGKVKPQLLLAIASDKSLTMLDAMKPQPLATILPLVKGEIAASKARLQVAVTDFEVR
jgi:hypothetical protein